MSITELLKHYNARFLKRKNQYGELNHVCLGGLFAFYLDELQDEDDIEEILVYVAHILNGGAHHFEKDNMSTNATFARIRGNDVEVTFGFSLKSTRKTEVIPLLDFKLILEEWQAFIRT